MNIDQTTAAKFAGSILTSGMNTVPNWRENEPIGYSNVTGAPIFDNVSFNLSENYKIGYYTNVSISLSKNVSVSNTFINGRKGGSVKQFINSGDWNITFNITIISDYLTNTNDKKIDVLNGINPNVDKFYDNYYPNAEMNKLNTFFGEFYDNENYQSVEVCSNYLNSNFGITNIIPYSISTQQNHESTNSYNVVIQAYSDINNEDDLFKLIMK